MRRSGSVHFMQSGLEIFKAISTFAAGEKGGPVGSIAGFLVDLFWNPGGDDVWELVHEQVGLMIDEALTEYTVETRGNDVKGLRRLVEDYDQYKSRDSLNAVLVRIHMGDICLLAIIVECLINYVNDMSRRPHNR